MPNPFQFLKVAETVVADTPALREWSVRLLSQSSALHTLVTTASENTGKAATHIAHTILPELNVGELTAKVREALNDQNWAKVREPAQLLVDRTEGVQPLAAPNVYGKFALAKLNHIEEDLPASEKGFQEITQSTSEWKVWTNSRTKIFEGYASMLRTAGRDEEAMLKDAHALGIKTELPEIGNFTAPFKLDSNYKHFATQASDEAADAAFYPKPYPDGFFDHGTLVDFTGQSPTVTVIDRQKDPLIQDLLARTTAAFDPSKLTPEQTATALAEYTRRLFPDTHLTAYYALRQANAGEHLLLGEWARLGVGVCNQHMLMFKTLAEGNKLTVNAYRGFLGNTAHDFNTVEIKGKEMLWDTTNYRWNEVFMPGKEYLAPFENKTWR